MGKTVVACHDRVATGRGEEINCSWEVPSRAAMCPADTEASDGALLGTRVTGRKGTTWAWDTGKDPPPASQHPAGCRCDRRPRSFPNPTGPTQANGRATYRYFVTSLLLLPGLGLRERKSNAICESSGRGRASPGFVAVRTMYCTCARRCSLKRGGFVIYLDATPSVLSPPSS